MEMGKSLFKWERHGLSDAFAKSIIYDICLDVVIDWFS